VSSKANYVVIVIGFQNKLLFASKPLPQYGRGFLYVCIMTLNQYREKATDEILYRMAKEVAEHDRDFTPNSITEDFWLMDLKNSLLPGGLNACPYKAQLHGNSIEIRFEDKWPVVLLYSLGRVIIGKHFITVDCLERAVEDMRFMTTLIPKYADEYRTAMANAVMEMRKENMIHAIYEATVAPSVAELINGRGLTCETRRNFRTVTMILREARRRVKTFYISYDNFQNELDEIKEFIVQHYPLKTEEEIAALAANCSLSLSSSSSA